jgi:signal transduction histidine kinase
MTALVPFGLAFAAAGCVVIQQRRVARARHRLRQLGRELLDRRDQEERCRILAHDALDARQRTEAKYAELKLRLNALERTQTLGKLAAAIAHDFNNILTTMMTNCQLARLDLIAGHPAVASLDKVDEAARFAAQMVRQIVTAARNETRPFQPLSLEPVVRDALELVRPLLPGQVKINWRPAAGCPKVMANAEQITQAVLNLGVNAGHAMKTRGDLLDVALELVQVEPPLAASTPNLKAGPYVRLTVRDNGEGMDDSTLQSIFKPFFTTRPDGTGAGLGLAIVQSIVENHQGAITVESKPGQGAAFHLYFPVSPTSDGPAAPDIGNQR